MRQAGRTGKSRARGDLAGCATARIRL